MNVNDELLILRQRFLYEKALLYVLEAEEMARFSSILATRGETDRIILELQECIRLLER